jgi:uncharacterized protein YjiS (DUF1127 family)
MLNSQSAITAIRRYSGPEQTSHVAPRDRRDIPGERLTPSAENSRSETNSFQATAMDRPDWPPVYWFFLEGFALYGASLHGLTTGAVAASSGKAGVWQSLARWWRERRKSISLVSSSARAELAVLESEDAIERTAFGSGMLSTKDAATREADRYRFVHPGWLSMIWRAIASRWAKRRREREITKAVAALQEYDDRLLRDLGIPHRSLIEQIVRDGRDC